MVRLFNMFFFLPASTPCSPWRLAVVFCVRSLTIMADGRKTEIPTVTIFRLLRDWRLDTREGQINISRLLEWHA